MEKGSILDSLTVNKSKNRTTLKFKGLYNIFGIDFNNKEALFISKEYKTGREENIFSKGCTINSIVKYVCKYNPKETDVLTVIIVQNNNNIGDLEYFEITKDLKIGLNSMSRKSSFSDFMKYEGSKFIVIQMLKEFLKPKRKERYNEQFYKDKNLRVQLLNRNEETKEWNKVYITDNSTYRYSTWMWASIIGIGKRFSLNQLVFSNYNERHNLRQYVDKSGYCVYSYRTSLQYRLRDFKNKKIEKEIKNNNSTFSSDVIMIKNSINTCLSLVSNKFENITKQDSKEQEMILLELSNKIGNIRYHLRNYNSLLGYVKNVETDTNYSQASYYLRDLSNIANLKDNLLKETKKLQQELNK